jgi:hypothetical protein
MALVTVFSLVHITSAQVADSRGEQDKYKIAGFPIFVSPYHLDFTSQLLLVGKILSFPRFARRKSVSSMINV